MADKKEKVNCERWMVIYPAYLNARRSTAQGRRISKEKACDNPSPIEIAKVLDHLKFKVALENKAYSRDTIQRGRIRVQFKDEAGRPVNPEFPNKRALLVKLGELIPKLAERQKSAQPSGGQGKRKGKKK